MTRPPGVSRPTAPAGLTGYRYALAVALLLALAVVPMLLAVAAGIAALDRSPAPPAVDTTPFVTYAPATGPGWSLAANGEPPRAGQTHQSRFE